MYTGRRYIGGWRWVAPVKAWARRQAAALLGAPRPETRPALVERRAAIARTRALRWTRANVRGGRALRRIPRHIKEMMKEARP